MNDFQKLIKEICTEEKIKFSLLSKDYIIKLEKDNKRFYINGYHFSLNNHTIGDIFDDKYATFELLEDLKIPVVYHEIVYAPGNKNDFAKDCNTHKYVYKYLFKNKENIIVKANNGFNGNTVFNLKNEYEVKDILDYLFSKSYSISVSPFINIKNFYTVVILNNKIELIYKKIKPVVIGNGKNSLKELLVKFNKNYFDRPNDYLKDYDYDKVLKDKEVFEYDWKYSLSSGGSISLEISDEEKNELLKIINKLTSKIEIGFATIDIIEDDKKEKMVLEINSDVALSSYMNLVKGGKKEVKRIYKKAIKKMFL